MWLCMNIWLKVQVRTMTAGLINIIKEHVLKMVIKSQAIQNVLINYQLGARKYIKYHKNCNKQLYYQPYILSHSDTYEIKKIKWVTWFTESAPITESYQTFRITESNFVSAFFLVIDNYFLLDVIMMNDHSNIDDLIEKCLFKLTKRLFLCLLFFNLIIISD